MDCHEAFRLLAMTGSLYGGTCWRNVLRHCEARSAEAIYFTMRFVMDCHADKIGSMTASACQVSKRYVIAKHEVLKQSITET